MTKLVLFFGSPKRFPWFLFRKSGITLLLGILSISSVLAQELEIKGNIQEEESKTVVIGATIRVKGQKTGTVSDTQGNFQLKIKTFPATLIVSSVGFRNQEIELYEATEPITVYLTDDQNRLSSVVVVGYGTQKRSELTGAIASIQVNQLKETGSTSFVNGLQGLASGIQVTQSSGAPGGTAVVRIRGGNSITGGNEPLYVIDGFPVYNDNSSADAGALNGAKTAAAGTSNGISPLSSINPEDIESVEVLKDASATAIYGSRGANGVIIVTTKKGSAGTTVVSYDGSYGIQRVAKTINLLNAQQFAIYANDARASSSVSPIFTQDQINSYANNSTDWQASAFRDAPVSNHQVSITGGNEKTKYSASLGYFSQDGIVIGSDFSRYSGRINLDSKISNNFTVGLNFNESYSNSDVVDYSTVQQVLLMSPTQSLTDYQNNYGSVFGNPIVKLNNCTNISKIFRSINSAFGEYEIIKGLKAKVLVGADLIYNKQNSYIPSTIYDGSASSGIASIGSKFTTNWLNENTLNYSRTINNVHSFDALVGFTQQQSSTEGYVAGATGFNNNIVDYNDLSSGTNTTKSTSTYTGWTLLSYLGRINYNYLHKYYFTGSLRADGSSRLGVANRWGYFPSGSFAWQIDKEYFLKNIVKAAKIDNFKLRLSAGVTGNTEIPSYQSESLLSAYSYPSGSSTSTYTGYASSQIANPDLKWEKTTQYDAGIDVALFRNRIKFTADAYHKKTSDLLLNVTLPSSSGYVSSLQNIGVVRNQGLEFSLATDNIRSKLFNWNSNITFSLNRNKVLSLGDGVTQILANTSNNNIGVIQVGQHLGSFLGLKTDGIYKSVSEIPATPLLTNTGVGDIKYVDVNVDGKITQAGDQTVIGSAQPKFIYGFSNNFSYANLDLSVFIQGSYGNQIYSSILQTLEVPQGTQNVIAAFANHYTSTNTNTNIQRANYSVANVPNSDLYVYDGSYLRFKTITLGYTVPKSFTSKLKISKIRLYISGQNLITISKYPGYDPEVNFFSADATRQGCDNGAYPIAKTILGGASITF